MKQLEPSHWQECKKHSHTVKHFDSFFYFFFLLNISCLFFMWIFKSLLHLFQYCFCFMIWLTPWPGIEPTPPILEGKVLTTGPPRKSLFLTKLNKQSTSLIPGQVSKRKERIYLSTVLYINVYSNFVIKAWNCKEPKCPLKSEWTKNYGISLQWNTTHQ